MAQKQTPDVYVEEVSLLSPSVAEVPTAIPAFMGYTEKTVDTKGNSIVNKPIRLTSMLDFAAHFGGPYKEKMMVMYKTDVEEFVIDKDASANTTMAKYFLYQSMAHFFANGGGTCYVVSVGGHTDTMKTKAEFMQAIEAIKKIDEVTLFCSPETVLLNALEHYDVHNASLMQAEKLMDRFALVDVQHDPLQEAIIDDSELMRANVSQGLKYGAAYYPYLKTSIARSYDEDKVNVALPPVFYKHIDAITSYFSFKPDGTEQVVGYDGKESGTNIQHNPYYAKLTLGAETVAVDLLGYPIHATGSDKGKRNGKPQYGIFLDEKGDKSINELGLEIDNLAPDEDTENSKARRPLEYNGKRVYREETTIVTLSELNNPDNTQIYSTAYYNQVKALLNKHYLYLPPSPAVAGAIAKTDAQRGVWKAPANVALSQVIQPSIEIDNDEQKGLNVDINAGKSINAIRAFVGKGTLIWGARTLDGNSNEWRYIPVRRLFNMVEESVKKASYFAVFEPNTPFTWLKIRTTIESYLENLWKQGALFGISPQQAFFVKIGLGQTMTEDDINNGYMNIEIGLAAVRPAEFIILKFSHKSIEG